MINKFLIELSELLDKYNYRITAEATSRASAVIHIKTTDPHTEALYTDVDRIDKDSLYRYFLTEIEWEPINEPVGKVNFLGKLIYVYRKSGWLAMNKNGSVFYFAEEPTVHYDVYNTTKGNKYYLGIMTGIKNNIWKNSAVYFNLSENENETV